MKLEHMACSRLRIDEAFASSLPPDPAIGLTEDIARRGVIVPLLVTNDGLVLDGHRRLAAARAASLDSVPVQRIDLDSCTDWRRAVAIAVNLYRRHLNEWQRVALGTSIERIERVTAKERQREGGKQGGKKAGKHRPAQGVDHGEPLPEPKDRATARVAAQVGVSRTTYERARTVLAEAPEIAAAGLSGKHLSVAGAYRELRKRDQVEQIKTYAFPAGTYPVIVIDPPWRYGRSSDSTHRGDCPYPTMSLDDIRAIEIPAADDCIVWLWTTNAFMRDAFPLLDHWGFKDKAILTWVKPRIGLGDWLRNVTEHCILAVRGKPVIHLTNQTTALSAPAGAHSEKPDAFYALVSELCPARPLLELFSRRKRDGWIASGAEV